MNNFFKLALTAFIVLLSTTSFMSCGGSDSDITGTWTSASSGMVAYFGSDGTGYIVESGDKITTSDRFTYEQSDNSIVLNWYNNDVDVVTYSLSDDGNTLIIYGLDDNDLATVVFTKGGSTTVTRSIVGIWKGNGMTAYFGSDQRGYLIETGETIKTSDWFTYSYNATINTIMVTGGGFGTKTFNCTLSSDGNTFTIYGIDNNDLAVLAMKKQN